MEDSIRLNNSIKDAVLILLMSLCMLGMVALYSFNIGHKTSINENVFSTGYTMQWASDSATWNGGWR